MHTWITTPGNPSSRKMVLLPPPRMWIGRRCVRANSIAVPAFLGRRAHGEVPGSPAETDGGQRCKRVVLKDRQRRGHGQSGLVGAQVRELESSVGIEARIVKDKVEGGIPQGAAGRIEIEFLDGRCDAVHRFAVLGIEAQGIEAQGEGGGLHLCGEVRVVEQTGYLSYGSSWMQRESTLVRIRAVHAPPLPMLRGNQPVKALMHHIHPEIFRSVHIPRTTQGFRCFAVFLSSSLILGGHDTPTPGPPASR